MEFNWSKTEKKIARQAFDIAFEKKLPRNYFTNSEQKQKAI